MYLSLGNPAKILRESRVLTCGYLLHGHSAKLFYDTLLKFSQTIYGELHIGTLVLSFIIVWSFIEVNNLDVMFVFSFPSEKIYR